MVGQRSGHLLVATNVVLLAALIGSNALSQSPPETADLLRARLIELVDDRGEVRAQLHIGEGGGGNLRLRNGQGEVRVKLGATADGAGLLLANELTEPGLVLLTKGSEASLTLRDPGKAERTITP